MSVEAPLGSHKLEAPPLGNLRRRSRHARQVHAVIAVACVAAAVGAALAPGRPTGLLGVDLVYRVVFAVLVTLACTYSRRWSWLVLAAIATAYSTGGWLVPAAIALTLAGLSVLEDRRHRRVGAVIGALAVQSLLRLPPTSFHGSTAIIVAVAAGAVFASAYRNVPPITQRRCRIAAACVGGIAIVFTVLVIVGCAIATSRIDTAVSQSERAATAAASGDAPGARAALDRANSALATAHSLIGSWFTAPGRLVPIAAQHRKALSTATGLSQDVTTEMKKALSTTNYDRLGLTHGHLDIHAIAAAQQQLTSTTATMSAAAAGLNPVHDQWVLMPIKNRLAHLDRAIAGIVPDTKQAADAARAVPSLLGADGQRRYFIALVDPAESRALGGTIKAYAEVAASNGTISVVRSGPISQLNNAAPPGVRHLTGLTDYQARYGAFAPADHLQDLTYSPDPSTVAEAIRQLYPQSGGDQLDGVVIVDPVGLGALVKATGPVHVDGLPADLKGSTTPRLINGADETTMATALRAALDQLTTKAVVEPRAASHWLASATQGRHVQVVSFHAAEDRYLREIGANRPYPQAAGGDVLGITTQNAGTTTVDQSLHRQITRSTGLDLHSGVVYTVLLLQLRNDAAQPNLTWLTMYSPLQMRADTMVDNHAVKMVAAHEFGLNTYSHLVEVPAHGTVKIRAVLSGVLPHPYQLTVVHQPTVNPDQVHVGIQVGTEDRFGVKGATAGRGKQRGTITWTGALTSDRTISVTLRGAGGGHAANGRAH